MPTQFTVFNNRNRDANDVYNSGSYTIPDNGDQMVRFTLNIVDLVAEPDTTVFHWTIERNDGSGWTHMVSGDASGRNGVEPPKPIGRIATSIGGIVGQDVRGSIYFESANDARKRYGVSGETY
jgi:hypothetical protein